MNVLVIDNYDSFTYNLVHLVAKVFGVRPTVVRNDERSWSVLRALDPAAIVVSPGPGHPARERDFGVSRDAIAHGEIPLLGVCLGHQGLAHFYGGIVEKAPQAIHGRTSLVRHEGLELFAGIPSPFSVARYHSLAVLRPVPPALHEVAQTDDGIVMALKHREKPQWGVQFHPESIITEYGERLIENFKATIEERTLTFAIPIEFRPVRHTQRRASWRVLPTLIDTQDAFDRLYADGDDAFWLDSALTTDDRARWSFMGDLSGRDAARVEFDAARVCVHIQKDGIRRTENVDIFTYLERARSSPPMEPPPVPFVGGFIGWFGYELRSLCGSPHAQWPQAPHALFFRVDRFIAIDHAAAVTYVVAVHDAPGADDALEWIESTVARLEEAPAPTVEGRPVCRTRIDFFLDRDKATYMRDIEQALRWIEAGECYQLCLTNQIRCESTIDAYGVYRALRRVNPAPYAAFLKWPGGAVMSASPERFLRADTDGNIETKPIKGTAARERDAELDRAIARRLFESGKDRAENVMIVDLLRNDFSRVCEVGSVAVTSLYGLETYATVHQLVSTVRGKLVAGATLVQAVREAFPGGSMTGAPKLRALELLDQLENRPRGPYSGALGWIGDDGAGDLSIVIRTIVATSGTFSIGVGGGIVAQSTAAGEFAEMLLKGKASIRAIVEATFGYFRDDLCTIHGIEDPVLELRNAD